MDLSNYATAAHVVANMSTPASDLMRIAQYHPSLRTLVAQHPQADYTVLGWLGSLGDAQLSGIIASRQAQFTGFAPPPTPSYQPAQSFASPQYASAAPPVPPPYPPQANYGAPPAQRKSPILLICVVVLVVVGLVAAYLVFFTDVFGGDTQPSDPPYTPPSDPSSAGIGWAHTLCGFDDDAFSGVTVDGNGLIVAIGGSSSPDHDFADVVLNSSPHAILAVFDANGELVFMRGDSKVSYYGVTTDNDGNVVIVGRTENSTGDPSPYIEKLSITIEVTEPGWRIHVSTLWTVYGFEGWEGRLGSVFHAAVNESGDIAVMGTMTDSTSFIAQLDERGKSRWIYPVDSIHRIVNLTTTKANDVVAVGSTIRPGGSNADSDGFAMMFSAEGEQKWQNSYGGAGFNSFDGVTMLGNNILAVGGGDAIEGSVFPSRGGTDAVVALIDPSGEMSWARTYGGAGTEFLTDVIAVSPTSFVGVGLTSSTDGDFGSQYTGPDLPMDSFVAQFDELGAIVWANVLGGSSFDHIERVTATAAGVIVVGATSSSDGNLPAACALSDAVIAFIPTI
ncbi:MAG: hypothetical protein FWD55_04475 [Propionibacteriaceae bacterium]|nr:hypothetical protein [Propionibacteriaceae bacterium]